MIRTAKPVPEIELNQLLETFLRRWQQFKEATWKGHYSGVVWWPNIISEGAKLARAIIGSREIPHEWADDFTAAAHLFIGSVRTPSDTVKWYAKNEKSFKLLEKAVKQWSPKAEATEDTTKSAFKVGPFIVHNSFGGLGEDLKGPIKAIEDAIQAVHEMSAVPGFNKVLYGNVYLVEQLRSARTAAWYNIDDDEVYIRTDVKASRDTLHFIIHELAHRYWHKFMTREMQQKFATRHSVCRYSPKDQLPSLPAVGDPIGFPVHGYKTPPKVIQILHGNLHLEGGGYITMDQWIKFQQKMRTVNCFPTPYASTAVDEHFCEVMGLKAAGKLEGDHLRAFEEIVEGKTVSKTAAGLTVDGVRYTWRRDRKTDFRDDRFRGYALVKPDGGLIANLSHTHDVAPYDHRTLEPPAWKVMIRVPATEEERGTHGTLRNVFLKPRFPSQNGDAEGSQAAMDFAVQAFTHWMKDRQHLVTKTSAFADISREMLENWLNTIPELAEKWHLKSGFQGVYLLPLSRTVAIKLSSTVGSTNQVVGVGKGSMQLALVSRITGQTINKKAQGQSYFARTTNWEKTWKEGIERMRDAYLHAQGFYDALAAITDRAKYKADLLAKIQGIVDWQNDTRLSDWYRRVFSDGILTDSQVGYIEEKANQPKAQGMTPENEKILAVLKELWKKGKILDDTYLMDFAKNVAEQKVKKNLPMTPGQLGYFNKMREKFHF